MAKGSLEDADFDDADGALRTAENIPQPKKSWMDKDRPLESTPVALPRHPLTHSAALFEAKLRLPVVRPWFYGVRVLTTCRAVWEQKTLRDAILSVGRGR